MTSHLYRLCNDLTSPFMCVCGGGAGGCRRTQVPYLSGLLNRSLQVCLHLVAGVACNLGNRLFKDGGRLSDGQSRVQVRLPSLDFKHPKNPLSLFLGF